MSQRKARRALGPRLPAPLQTALLWRDPGGFLAGSRRSFGDAFHLRLWPIGDVLVICSPELIAGLTVTPNHELRCGEATRRVLPILGEQALPCLDGEQHAARRRTLLPVFSGRRLDAHADRIAAAVAAELACWPQGELLRALPRLRPLALAIACEIVLGAQPPHLGQRLQRFVTGRAALASWFPSLRPARLLLDRRRRELDELLLGLVRRPPPGEHALAALLAAGLEPEAVAEELRALLLVAHESTACALAWTLERLARHSHVLERLRDGDEAYLDAVAREVLRSRPPVLDAVRLARRSVALPDGRAVPAGTIVMAVPLLLHHRADLYPAPDEFRPERFLDGMPPEGADLAFGGGARRCLGAQLATLEIKALLRVLAARYSLLPAIPAPEQTLLRGTAVAPAQGATIALLEAQPRSAASSTAASSTVTGGRSSVC
jgi:cytochrome P450 family 135